MLKVKNPPIVRSVEGSVTPAGIYCLFDNRRRVMLARYLESKYGMSPQEYREYCGLPDDYPMTAALYAEKRQALAKDDGDE